MQSWVLLEVDFSAILLHIMETIKLLERDLNGKKNKVLLSEGFVPAVVYNAKTESKNIMLDLATAKQIAREVTSTTILDVDLEGKAFKAVVKEIDVNPITEDLRHIAFLKLMKLKTWYSLFRLKLLVFHLQLRIILVLWLKLWILLKLDVK